MHLLHALPSSRRKAPQMVSVGTRRPSSNGFDTARPIPSAAGAAPAGTAAAAAATAMENSQNHIPQRHQLGTFLFKQSFR